MCAKSLCECACASLLCQKCEYKHSPILVLLYHTRQHTHTHAYTHVHTGYHESRLSVAKQEIDAKWQRRMQREKEAVSERLLNSLDKDGQAEMADNVWLKREV